jgi:hypothetical protein
MLLRKVPSSFVSAGLLAGIATLGLSLLTGCGMGEPVIGATNGSNSGSYSMSGILHGGPNPIIGATITLYVTNSTGYGNDATVVGTPSQTDSSGFFSVTLPTGTQACPSGEYAYLGAYQGNTGSYANNVDTLLMVPIGLCDTNYSYSAGVNTYNGQSLWIDELTTVVSAYALGPFMSVTNVGAINISTAAKNLATTSTATPSAAGLAHAFANALAIVNNHTGQPSAYTHGGTSNSTGGVIPDAEIFLLGNVLQACVNSAGTTGMNTATANDGSGCGMLFSFTTPPQTGAAVPTNTLQAMVNLAKYPNPLVNTWNAGPTPTACTAAGSGTTTATTCLFNLANSQGAYIGALTSAPPDWALAVVYTTGYGAQTTACTGTCPGLVYPYYVALDYADNVYVLNYSASATTYTNIIGVGYDGTPLFSSPEDSTHLTITNIGTDTAGHVFGINTNATGSSCALEVYSTASGANVYNATNASFGATSAFVLADPLNDIFIASSQSGINLRKATYATGPTYTVASVTTTPPSLATDQITFGTNLDLYFSSGPSSSPAIFLLPNTATYTKGTPAAPTYSATGLISTTITGTTSNAYGIAGLSTGGAIAIDSVGATPITKSGATIAAGTPTALPGVYNATLYNRGAVSDGLNNVFSVDGANGSAVSGVTVFDSTDSIALGTYKGCYVISKACGTTAGSAPMYSPRGAVIDSAGDVWVVSGASASLTELIGAAAPTWPALSLGLRGEPQ